MRQRDAAGKLDGDRFVRVRHVGDDSVNHRDGDDGRLPQECAAIEAAMFDLAGVEHAHGHIVAAHVAHDA